jgi:hypothetical protein
MDPFETRLGGLLRAHTQAAAIPSDPYRVARTAMIAPAPGILGWTTWSVFDHRLARTIGLIALAIVVTSFALLAGAVRRPEPIDRLLFIRDGDLYVANGDGSTQTRIAEGGDHPYLTAAWSPGSAGVEWEGIDQGRRIAATIEAGGQQLRADVSMLTDQGALWEIILDEPGGVPSLAWSPDGTRLLVVEYPGAVRGVAVTNSPA